MRVGVAEVDVVEVELERRVVVLAARRTLWVASAEEVARRRARRACILSRIFWSFGCWGLWFGVSRFGGSMVERARGCCVVATVDDDSEAASGVCRLVLFTSPIRFDM